MYYLFTLLFIEHLDRTSFVLGIFSLYISYWFWKNPISTEITKERRFFDNNQNLKYKTGYNHRGWIVKKINYDALIDFTGKVASKMPMKEYASRKNNPEVKKLPSAIEELDKLNFSEE